MKASKEIRGRLKTTVRMLRNIMIAKDLTGDRARDRSRWQSVRG